MQKKIIYLVVFLFLSLPLICRANEEENAPKYSIMYRWYKEKSIGDYYPIFMNLDGYLTDELRIKYTDFNSWDRKNCSVSGINYIREAKIMYTYNIINDIKYVVFSKKMNLDNIDIYCNYQKNSYNLINEGEKTKIILSTRCAAKKMFINVKNVSDMIIDLYDDDNIKALSKNISSDNNIIIPDNSWIYDKSKYVTLSTTDALESHPFNILTDLYVTCRYKELLVYKYKIEKEYYDENYYTELNGYKKDYENFFIKFEEETENKCLINSNQNDSSIENNNKKDDNSNNNEGEKEIIDIDKNSENQNDSTNGPDEIVSNITSENKNNVNNESFIYSNSKNSNNKIYENENLNETKSKESSEIEINNNEDDTDKERNSNIYDINKNTIKDSDKKFGKIIIWCSIIILFFAIIYYLIKERK